MTEAAKPPSYIIMQLSDSDSYIIGKMMSEDNQYIKVQYPLRITVETDGESIALATTKMFPFSETNIIMIRKERIVSVTKPNENVMKYYEAFLARHAKYLDGQLEDDTLGITRGVSTTVAVDEETKLKQRAVILSEFEVLERDGATLH